MISFIKANNLLTPHAHTHEPCEEENDPEAQSLQELEPDRNKTKQFTRGNGQGPRLSPAKSFLIPLIPQASRDKEDQSGRDDVPRCTLWYRRMQMC
jgi:hypothetical protein